LKPKDFLFENVASMSDKSRDAISELLMTDPVMIDAALVSGQSRKRLFWASFPITVPRDTGIRFIDLLDDEEHVDEYALSTSQLELMNRIDDGGRDRWDYGFNSDTDNPKSACLMATWAKGPDRRVLIDRRPMAPLYREFTINEAERLMGFPDDWTKGIPMSYRFECVGNSVSVPVIQHLMECYVSAKRI
jgi:site-specific DNA-cytosine methylase